MRPDTFNILVAIDFSDCSAGAMYHAASLAERFGAVLHLVHVTPQDSLSAPTDLGLNVPAIDFASAHRARERLERLRAMLSGKIAVELHLRMGDAVQQILEVTRELKPDMVVVGSHGYGAVMRILLGSVSTQLVRKSPVPVLVIPAPGREEAGRAAEPTIEPPLPSVGTGPSESLSLNRTNDSSSGSVNVAPAGFGGYDVNPELRVRY